MKALSIQQPWAWLICAGCPFGVSVDNGDGSTHIEDSGKVILKDIENRDWPTSIRGRIYVHAAKRQDNFEECLDFLFKLGLPLAPIMLMFSSRIPRGAIIGEVDIVDCVTTSKSPWFVGEYGFVLANPKLYDKPIPCKGALGFFEPRFQPLKSETKG